MSDNKLTLTTQLIIKDFSLEETDLPEGISKIDELKVALKKIVSYLLDRDMSRLLLALYRIDVSEKKVKQVLAEAEPGKIAESITDLIIERELQKVETRIKYSGQ
ncbi:hypothetical protein [Fulvivirga lutimaris]|uniref:hypothetical protein n=1 Tax=Fulvivirga lutimaris TaxID=1819566 RepID=UPI0012BBC0A1|nr:hypothetical protein [Fulvivirga lutimaris]MTI38149.1 hypothetical protein [Fulvivirga lutimaris]